MTNTMRAILQHNDCQIRIHVPCDDWKDPINSDPITDVDDARETFVEGTGVIPSQLLVNIETHHALRSHPLMLDRIWNCRELRTLSREDLAAIFDVEKYVVEGDAP